MTRYITLLLAVLGISAVQIVVKYRFNLAHGAMPADASLMPYFWKLLADIWLWGTASNRRMKFELGTWQFNPQCADHFAVGPV